MSEIAREDRSIRVRRFVRPRLALMALPLLFLVACGETPVQPEPEPEPEPDLSIGEVFYLCGWKQGRPATPRVIVDLLVIPEHPDPDAWWYPLPVSAGDEARVLAVGGRIMHRFNAMMVRVDLATDSLPVLLDSLSVAYYALSVPDTLRTDYVAVLSFDHAPTRQDSIVIRQLGGWARVHPYHPQFMEGAIPDSIVPALRNRGLVYLQAGPNPAASCSIPGSSSAQGR